MLGSSGPGNFEVEVPVGEVIPFKRPKTLSDKFRGTSLCRDGFHKWTVVKDKQFDVKAGKLVTIYRCDRCGKQQTKTH